MVVMFAGCLVLGDDPNIEIFLPHKTYGSGVFVLSELLYRCKAANKNQKVQVHCLYTW